MLAVENRSGATARGVGTPMTDPDLTGEAPIQTMRQDGAFFTAVLSAGLERLTEHVERVNALNVFPVDPR